MELTTEIMDLELTIQYTAHKAELMTRHYPGCPADLEWEITHICGMSLKEMWKVFGYDSMATLHDWIIEHDDRKAFEKLIEAACWEDLKESEAEMIAYQLGVR